MNRALLILAGAVSLALAAYAIYYEVLTRPSEALLAKPEARLEWLRREFGLSDAQFARVTALHTAYEPVCAALCERIASANARLEEMIPRNGQVTPELEAALLECATVRRDCNAALLQHAYAVAAEMPSGSGKRYLEMMSTRLTQAAPWYSKTMAHHPE